MRAGLIIGALLAFGGGIAHQKLRQAFADHRDLRARTAAARKARWGFLPPAAWWWVGLGALFLLAAQVKD